MLYQEYQRLGDQLRLKENQIQSREFEDEAYKLQQMFEELERLHDEIDRQRTQYKTKTAAEREAIEHRLRDAQSTHSTEIAAPDLKELRAKLKYLADAIRPVTRILSIRLWFEILFPTAFAVIAILIGVFAR